jgi:hypothetical protein
MFHAIDNPPQWMLDGLLEENRKMATRSCPDCGVEPGNKHRDGCDVARCVNPETSKVQQRLMCGCGDCGEDTWEGFWPGIKEAYELGFVCYDDMTKTVSFDLNRTMTELAFRG